MGFEFRRSNFILEIYEGSEKKLTSKETYSYELFKINVCHQCEVRQAKG